MSAPRGRVRAVVPVKPLAEALGRLAPALSAPERRELQERMLHGVLVACREALGPEATLVVTADARAAALALAGRARVVADHDPPRGMNAAVALGCARARAEGADAALVLTADLPLAGAEELRVVVEAAPPAPAAVLVPSRDGTGTNAMLLRPPGALEPQLGPDSLARHRAQARRRAVAVRVLPLPGLALDIDTPADLEALAAGSRR